MQQDLNDLYYYVQVVEHGGFAQAGRALGMPKSKLSRRLAMLEGRLGVRLIQRSTRSFAVTELGQAYYGRCKAMLVEAEAAQAVIESTQAEPCGIVRLSCPIALLHAHVRGMLVDFALHYPSVSIQLSGMNRAVDVVAEGLDVAIRVRPLPLDNSDLAMRVLGYAAQYLVASPILLERYGMPQSPADLLAWPSLGFGPPMEGQAWTLLGPEGAQAVQHHTPRFVTTDMLTLGQAAVAGIGVVQLPAMMVREELADGRLVRVLPDWAPRREIIHAIFPSRRGLLPSVRALIDFLAERFGPIEED
ncbi:LysR family transcriptional regulator [Massilia niastensis]|uniref:LysR family transcriptional regulator n=1 Tax=Massilia niastensis TaxID=544911 RepID=UPI000376A93D|nr:LysR family transcriptional regulator [Massilia niastensis]